MNKNIKYFKIIDILHTGHHGPKGKPKEGAKYDTRRLRCFSLDMNSLQYGECLTFNPVIKLTTPFEKFWYENGYYHILTLNSEYIVEEIQYDE